MSINLGKQKAPAEVVERTCRIDISCNVGEDPRVVAYREIVGLDGEGKLTSRAPDMLVVQRPLSKIAEQEFGDVNGGQILQRLWDMLDELRKEDIANQRSNGNLPEDGRKVPVVDSKAAAD